MYDIRQFKPTLYLVVMLGLTGFAIAAKQPALWVLSVGAVMINAWLVRTGRFTPMPRWLSNGITLLSSGFVLMQVIGNTNTGPRANTWRPSPSTRSRCAMSTCIWPRLRM